VVEGQEVMAFAAAGRTIVFEVQAEDENLNDKVTRNSRLNKLNRNLNANET
jgi:hypothetical protein